jgi:thymidylate kinase
MLIIVEGMDKTGKSTLCNYLMKKLPEAYLIKNGVKPLDASLEERAKIKKAYDSIFKAYNMAFSDQILIVDRFVISELVYSYKRGYDAKKDTDIMEFVKFIEDMENNAAIVYCTAPAEVIEQKFIDDKEDYTKIEEIVPLMKKYDEALSLFKNTTKLYYDYTKMKMETIAKQIWSMKEYGPEN